MWGSVAELYPEPASHPVPENRKSILPGTVCLLPLAYRPGNQCFLYEIGKSPSDILVEKSEFSLFRELSPVAETRLQVCVGDFAPLMRTVPPT